MIVFLGSQSAQTPLFAGQENCFGSKDPGLFNMKGNLYFLPDGNEGMPEKLGEASSSGVIYTDHLDVPSRSFTEGFPGVTDRFEWFGLLYTGQFEVEKTGEYRWRLFSDDGSRLWIDGNEVIDNDGVHPGQEKDGVVSLTRGPHSIKVWYFQGPADEIAIQLFVTPPGGGEIIFSMKDFSTNLGKEIEKVQAKPTAEGIKVQLDAAVLFDTGKSIWKTAGSRSSFSPDSLLRSIS
ncbi:MAG: PA14 domain-containing protein [Candidatus Ozemobacteraceae bacterium]